MSDDKVKMLLDTDIGSDIDDAVCLAYLLAQPRCELLGVTTVSGEPDRRAMMASALCRVAGKDVPVYPGVERPLLGPQQQPQAPQAAALSRWPHETRFPHGEAVEFLRRTIRANPGEVTLLTIGPLTNAALLFAADPEAASMLKALVMMAGIFAGDARAAEWNARCDPHATAIVYGTAATVHRSVGLDVTMKVQMDREEVRRRFQAPLLRPVMDFAEVWFERAERLTFHDPLAAVTVFNDRVCRFERGTVEVDITSGDPKARGLTRWTPGGDGPHEIALEVDREAFFEEYFGVFG